MKADMCLWNMLVAKSLRKKHPNVQGNLKNLDADRSQNPMRQKKNNPGNSAHDLFWSDVKCDL